MGAVGLWRLNDGSGSTVADASGNANTGTLHGSPTWVTGVGGTGLALSLNGSTDYVSVADSAVLDLTAALSIAVWIRPTKTATQYVVKKAAINATDGYEIGLASTGTVFFRLNQKTSANTYRIDSTSSYPIDGATWMHVAATYDGTTMRLYINGTQQASAAGPAAVAANNLVLAFGSDSTGGAMLAGTMDLIEVYDYALSAGEVTNLAGPTTVALSGSGVLTAATPTAPTLAASGQTAWNTTATSKTASVTLGAGDVLVVKASVENTNVTLSTPTGGGLTWTLRQTSTTANYSPIYVWTATSSSAQTFTLSVGASGTAATWGFAWEVWSGSGGVGASVKGQSASGAPSLAITPTGANSALSVLDADWNAVAGTTRTYRTVNGFTPTAGGSGESGAYPGDGSSYGAYSSYYPDAGAAGAQTVGMTAPTGQKYNIAAVELTGSTSTGTGSAVTGSAALSGSGSLTAAGTPTVAATAPLSGAGALSVTTTLTASGAAALTGVGTLAASGSPSASATAALTGSGTLTATATQAASGAATLTGTGALTATGAPAASASVSLSGTGTPTASGTPTVTTTATLAGVGVLGSSGALVASGTAVFTGSGSLAANGMSAAPGTAGLSGSGSLTATGTPAAPGVAGLSGSGSLTAAGTPAVAAAATFSGSGSLSGMESGLNGNPSESVFFTGSGVLSANGVPAMAVAVGRSSSGTLTAAGSAAVSVSAAFSGAGALTTSVLSGSVYWGDLALVSAVKVGSSPVKRIYLGANPVYEGA